MTTTTLGSFPVRTLAHISDLHFGTESPTLLHGLARSLAECNPTLVAVSGDLTQRGRSHQFRAAMDYLNLLPYPMVIVPGNHDIPLFNLYRRALRPLRNYRRAVGQNSVLYVDEEVVVAGLDTTKPYGWKEGNFSRRRLERLKRMLCETADGRRRVVVAHHPLPHRRITQLQTDCDVDMILSGHHHVGRLDLEQPMQHEDLACLVVHAGTALSRRTRTQANSFNIITMDDNAIAVTIRVWNGEAFVAQSTRRFSSNGVGWREV